jgi:hypothetical protein
MKMLLVAVAFATLVASPVLAQSPADQGSGASGIHVKQKMQSRLGYRCDPYFWTYWDGVAPYGSSSCPDPYAGTRWEGVAPY